MRKEDVLNLMTDLPPDLIEEADFDTPAKRRLPKLARAGLIAACLCLVLIGATGAAQLLGVRILDFGGGYFRLWGKAACLPYDSLSDQIKALGDQGRTVAFPSWQEMEDFIGLDLMNNPVLDGAGTTDYTIEFDGENVQHVLSIGYQLTSVSTISCFQLGDVRINLQSRFYTDRIDDLDEGSISDFSLAEGSKTGRERYTAPSGLEAMLLRIDRERDNYHGYQAVFSLNGVSFVLGIHSYHSEEEARAALVQILDGFSLA